jgi:hypothetical protein
MLTTTNFFANSHPSLVMSPFDHGEAQAQS